MLVLAIKQSGMANTGMYTCIVYNRKKETKKMKTNIFEPVGVNQNQLLLLFFISNVLHIHTLAGKQIDMKF